MGWMLWIMCNCTKAFDKIPYAENFKDNEKYLDKIKNFEKKPKLYKKENENKKYNNDE